MSGLPYGMAQPSHTNASPALARGLYQSWQGMNNLQRMGLLPVVGDAAGLLGDLQMMYEDPEERTFMNGLLAVAGALPFVPAGLGMLGYQQENPYQ